MSNQSEAIERGAPVLTSDEAHRLANLYHLHVDSIRVIEAKILTLALSRWSRPPLSSSPVARAEVTEEQVGQAWDAAREEVGEKGHGGLWDWDSTAFRRFALIFARRIAPLSSAPQDAAAGRREAAKKAWDAAHDWWWRDVFKRDTHDPVQWPGSINSDAARDRFLSREYPAPAAAPRSVRLSDGRVFEMTAWDWRNHKDDPHTTFDIVTNKGKPGCESRVCYKSVEQMREQYQASWADWKAIDESLASTLAGRDK